ncbi:ubiquinol-cytochrome c reductase iron-sulfur subunit [Helicobacter kayseriensis]|uniref:ubiquinol-cytochrome c reductase iron-sulfur subunit n=1 Tax=Helicobacter kayseriensis TaxID=2905877 RepID=UPI001E3752F8|nr:ubiquinol-cytochrome c reductase iron-sulfur subunit [Helicobacter kayseriensis]MCE3046933.1 ubiquinol-cytochrome c reductase iron-sulfur subunit [Helicobacter kayseriensis]MCE3048407.1 ubiquinol-cytochrome c reductase iron-sulfur subunit [Helicobacter kayseriensis]
MNKRRDFIGMALGGGAALGAAASLVAMKRTWDPLPNVVSAGFTTVDISSLQEGEMMTVEWRKKPVYILRMAKNDADAQNFLGKRNFQIGDAIYTIGIQVCTHLGCIPGYDANKKEFLCACHGGRFNSSGINAPGTPPPKPMTIPPFKILEDGKKILLGEAGEEYNQLSDKE